jgi:GTP-binding nuclear protein Ran
MMRQYKIALLGDPAVGKTSLVKVLKVGYADKRYVSTVGAEVHPIPVHTNQGPILLDVWDYAGKEEYSTTQSQANIAAADLIVIMYSLDNRATFNNAKARWTQLARSYSSKPILLLGNKRDTEVRTVNAVYPEISCRSDPASVAGFIQQIITTLTGDNTIQVIEDEPLPL